MADEKLICKMRNDISVLQTCVAQLKNNPVLPEDWRCEEVCVVIGYATVAQDGTVAILKGEGASIERTDVGTYAVTAPVGAEVAIPTVVEAPATRDSIEIHMGTSFTGGTVHISEGDNGTAANVLRDRPWAITWYGRRKVVLCDVETG